MSRLGDRCVRIAARPMPAWVSSQPLSSVRRALPVMMLLCGLFLAHGLQCAATHADDAHGPGASVSSAAHSADAGAMGSPAMTSVEAQSATADQDSARHGSGLALHIALACLAVLGSVLLVALLAGRHVRVFRRRLVERGRHLLRTGRSWRPPAPSLTALCLSRT